MRDMNDHHINMEYQSDVAITVCGDEAYTFEWFYVNCSIDLIFASSIRRQPFMLRHRDIHTQKQLSHPLALSDSSKI
jgi:hypothetical protein